MYEKRHPLLAGNALIDSSELGLRLARSLDIMGENVKQLIFYQLEQRGFVFKAGVEYPLEQVRFEIHDIIGELGGNIVMKSIIEDNRSK